MGFTLHRNNAPSVKGQMWIGFLFFYIKKQLFLNSASQKTTNLDKNVHLS